MKTNLQSICILMAIGSLLLNGCSTPTAVKNLQLKTQMTTQYMGQVHQQDLQTLAAYDRARVQQFNQLLSEYFSLRLDIVNSFNEALDQSKQACLARLDLEFDRRAEQITTVLFWSGFQGEADKGLNQLLKQDKDNAVAKKIGADAFPSDPQVRNESFLEARKIYMVAALKYETVESSFAELVNQIDQARAQFHTNNEYLLSEIKPFSQSNLPGGLTNIVLPDNTGEINQRIKDLQIAYTMLGNAQEKMQEYLDNNNPPEDFFQGVFSALTGMTNIGDTVGKNSVPVAPSTPSMASIPGLGNLAALFTDKIKDVEAKESAGTSTLDQVINQLIANSKVPLKVAFTPTPSSGAVTASTSNP